MFKSMFSNMKKKGESLLNKESAAAPPRVDPENPPTRWEKAVVCMNGIVQQVSTIDPDGIDVVCFPGTEGSADGTDVDVYRNLKDAEGLKAMVTARPPSGPCEMSKAMEVVFREALQRGFERPCSILVLTAGRPDESDLKATEMHITNTARSLQKASDLTVTFVQVGDDPAATTFLKHLDDDLTCVSATGEAIDIVDTIKDEEIKKALGEVKDGTFMQQGGTGALLGAFAGAAMGAGGMYLYNKVQAKKRGKGGWNGKWKATFDGDEIAVIKVKDDMDGNLTITGWPEDQTSTGIYMENEDGLNIMRTEHGVATDEYVYGTVEDEHTVTWSDGTRWEEVPPKGEHWGAYVGAAAAGAAATGAVGYLVQKKFFKKAANKVPSDYVILMDRSAMMAIPDAGK